MLRLRSIAFAIFSIQLFSIVSKTTQLPEALSWILRVFVIIITTVGIHIHTKSKEIDRKGMVTTYIFVAWLLIQCIIGSTQVEGYWMWKSLISNFLITCIYILIIGGTNVNFTGQVYKYFWKYSLLLVLLSFIVSGNPRFLSYVPFSTLLIFFGSIPNKQKIKLATLIVLFFLFEYQRNDLIKIIFASTLGLSIAYAYNDITKYIFRTLGASILIAPFALLYLGMSGQFNVFRINDYLSANYTIDVTNKDGQIVKEDISIDTRTFIYKNVAYTLTKYDTWIFGRNPAHMDEGPIGFASETNEVTNLKGRYGNEVGIMDILLWYGIIGATLYFLIYARASYLAIYKSKSKYCVGIGVYAAFVWAWSFIWEKPMFEIFFMMNLIVVGMCFSKKFRSMNNTEVQLWVSKIFL